ncbi:MAG: DUF4105 domain-containing protein [Treponema sp.]|jgi:hypothetical protein|nr:DUF4105 domain-containing protein [Treponema sp.]
MIKRIVLLLILFCVLSMTLVFSQGENLILKIAVAGPGDELYFWWGHIALMIDDTAANRSRFYDYGLFSFENDNFFFNFAFGRLLYSCGSSPSDRNIASYINTNRDIIIYTLDLPPEKRIEIQNFAEKNVLPENRDYFYHHFKDNCSTRIRDIIDLATDGQFIEEFGQAPGRFTLREHVRRHTWFFSPADWILNFWMGQDIDVGITVWDEMFLPSEVGKRIEDFWYTDSNGIRRKLVTSVETVYEAKNRPVVLDVPRKQWPRELAFSLVISVLIGFFFFLQQKKYRAGRILTGVSMSFAGFVFGFAGLLLYFLNLFTNHDYTYHNANMLFGSPLLLAAVPLGICYAVTKNDRRRFIYSTLSRLIWFLTVLGIFASILIKILPGFWQQNLTDQMLILPIALIFTLQPAGLREIIQKIFRR